MNVAIIGAGSIGGLIDNPNSQNIASHAHAYKKNSTCTLVAICEPNIDNQKEFTKRWGKINIYKNSKELLKKEDINILSIATPTKYHASNILEALHTDSVSHILCEKPLIETPKELEILKEGLEKSNKKILINLIRRYDPSFINLASQIKSKKWGKALSFHGNFTKNLLHNGIHILGVLSHLLGSIDTLTSQYNNFFVKCNETEGTLTCIENLGYSLFELEIIFEYAKIEIKDGGAKISIYEKAPSSLYENYFTLEYKDTLENTLNNYASNSLSFLLKETSFTCKEILKEHIKLHEQIFEAIK